RGGHLQVALLLCDISRSSQVQRCVLLSRCSASSRRPHNSPSAPEYKSAFLMDVEAPPRHLAAGGKLVLRNRRREMPPVACCSGAQRPSRKTASGYPAARR